MGISDLFDWLATTNEFNVANNVDNNTLTELEDDMNELYSICKELKEICPSLFGKKCEQLKRQTPDGYTLPRL